MLAKCLQEWFQIITKQIKKNVMFLNPSFFIIITSNEPNSTVWKAHEICFAKYLDSNKVQTFDCLKCVLFERLYENGDIH